jgi:hypothetical protein
MSVISEGKNQIQEKPSAKTANKENIPITKEEEEIRSSTALQEK